MAGDQNLLEKLYRLFLSLLYLPIFSTHPLSFAAPLNCHACWDTYWTEWRRCDSGYLVGLSLGCLSTSLHTSENSSQEHVEIQVGPVCSKRGDI